MYSRFRPLTKILPQIKYKNNAFLSFSIPIQHLDTNSINSAGTKKSNDDQAFKIQTLLRTHSQRSIEEIEQRLGEFNLLLSEDLIIEVLKRHRSDWRPAYAFFNWVRKANNSTGISSNTSIYNEILDILGKMKRFEEVRQVLDEMSKRKDLINEQTFGIVVSKFAAGHKVDEAIQFFHKIEEYFGLEKDLVAFQTLLLSLCRYKHVEVAELLFRKEKSKFRNYIKTWNIILNGWCVLGSLRDAKRFWKDTVTSIAPDKFTYAIFINSLVKSGKISTAMKLLRLMWEKGCPPDVAICNSVIDGLCFKKRIPEALQIFDEMNERNCPPNVGTYNSLIKHFCKIQRMEKVEELLKKMEEIGDTCLPNTLTYGHLMKIAKTRGEVDEILERMVKSGCKLDLDISNLILRLFVQWGDEERGKWIWDEMERSGLGPDQRSYTVMIHGLYDKGMTERALEYFCEMTSKGMVLEPRTKILVDDIKFKMNGLEVNKDMELRNSKVSLK